jgi:hypothetical protein
MDARAGDVLNSQVPAALVATYLEQIEHGVYP